jgi:hypothetical protein
MIRIFVVLNLIIFSFSFADDKTSVQVDSSSEGYFCKFKEKLITISLDEAKQFAITANNQEDLIKYFDTCIKRMNPEHNAYILKDPISTLKIIEYCLAKKAGYTDIKKYREFLDKSNPHSALNMNKEETENHALKFRITADSNNGSTYSRKFDPDMIFKLVKQNIIHYETFIDILPQFWDHSSQTPINTADHAIEVAKKIQNFSKEKREKAYELYKTKYIECREGPQQNVPKVELCHLRSLKALENMTTDK